MNWLEFAEKMVGHLAWPVVVLIIVFAVRKHLGSLAERILELSFGGATVKFDKLLTKGAELIEETEEEEEEEDEDREAVSENLARHLDKIKEIRSQPVDETLALTLFRDIELKLAEIGVALGISVPQGRFRARDVMHYLRKKKIVDTSFVKLFDTLQQGRNLLAHARKPSKSELEEYIRQASFFLVQLDIWKEQIEKKKPPQ